MTRGALVFAGGLLVLFGAGVGVWTAATTGEAPSSASFGYQDWLVRCRDAGDETRCGMSQQILDQRSRRPVLQLHLAWPAKGEGHELIIVMPLGVGVPPGVAIQIGEVKRNVAFTQCLPGGCVAPMVVDDGFLDTLKTGSNGRVGVVDRTDKTVAVPFSLKGFAAAFAKMEERSGGAGNDATWWTRFWNSSETK